MIEVGIFDGDFVVARVQDTATTGDIVVAGIGEDEATVKRFRSDGADVILEPANERLEPMRFPDGDVEIYGRVVTVLRRL